MRRLLGGLSLLVVCLTVAACRSARPAQRSDPPDSSAAVVSAAVVTEASVVAFWLSRTDTVPEAARGEARERFRASNAQIGKYLSDTDITLIATVSDTVVVALAGGTRRVLTLVGLDFPYGYVLIEPGYAEEYHTGVPEAADLEDAIDDYFGLEDPSPAPRHRIARQLLPEPRGLLDILRRGREGSALRNRNSNALVSSAAVWRRGCARCAWLRGPARRGRGAAAGFLSRSR